MTDRPILFSKPMVQALLDGTKTQTRRGLYLKRLAKDGGAAIPSKFSIYHGRNSDGVEVRCDPPRLNLTTDPMGTWWALNPLVNLKPGDRLWVKETWRTYVSLDAEKPTDLWSPDQPRGAAIFYEAGGNMAIGRDAPHLRSYGDGTPAVLIDRGALGKTRVSIHMPKWASRLTLTITGRKVERLQKISDEDCKAEGIGEPYLGDGDPPFVEQSVMVSRWMQYRNLWARINGMDSWAANPWVIALSFTVDRRNIEEIDRG